MKILRSRVLASEATASSNDFRNILKPETIIFFKVFSSLKNKTNLFRYCTHSQLVKFDSRPSHRIGSFG
jgi:hypothetical protein